MGHDYDVNDEWLRKLLKHMSLLFKASSTSKTTHRPAEEVDDARANLKEKVTFLGHTFAIPQERVANLDPTSVQVVPVPKRGWATSGSKTIFIDSGKGELTLCVVAPMSGGPVVG